VKETDEVKERRIEEEHESAPDLEMTDALDPPVEQPEREKEQLKGEQEAEFKEQRTETEHLNKETEAERSKRERTEQEGRKMVQESGEKVFKGPASERAGDNTLNIQEGQEPEKEPASQELADLLQGVRTQCGEVKDALHKCVKSGGRVPTATEAPPEFKESSPKPSLGSSVQLGTESLKPSGEPPLNPLPLGIPEAPPPVPVEMMDVQVQTGERVFQGRDTWEVTFLSTGSVRVEIHVMNAQGELEEPTTIEMSVEKFFRTKSTWSPNIRPFKFQNEALPPILSTAMDKIF
jgi:hypothetical protein